MFGSLTNSDRPRLSLEADLMRLLAQVRGEAFPKKLFWELLSYDRVNEALPLSVLPGHFRGDVAGASILARAGTLYVCYLQLRVSELSAGVERPILQRLAGQWPVALLLFSNFGETEWDFCWHMAGRPRETQRLMVDANEQAVKRLARLLAGLAAANLVTNQPLPELELAEEFDRVFAKSPMRKRERIFDDQTDLIFRSVRKWELLTAEEEIDLSRRWRLSQDNQAREKLVCANLRLVIWVAQRYQDRGLDIEDLIQEGGLGLLTAAERFDPDRGARFGTYATWWIRQGITRAIANQGRTIRIPAHLIDVMSRVHKVSKKLLKEMGRKPSIEETAKAMGITVNEAHRVLMLDQHPISLHWPVREREDKYSGYFTEHGSSEWPVSNGNQEGLKDKIEQVLNTLTYREREVIKLRYGLTDGEPYTLEEVGRIFKVTRERIRQIEAKAFGKLRKPVRSGQLAGFLD